MRSTAANFGAAARAAASGPLSALFAADRVFRAVRLPAQVPWRLVRARTSPS